MPTMLEMGQGRRLSGPGGAATQKGGIMNAATLLDRLDRVREVGPGRWVAACPAHDDRTPSLSIQETADGLILVHDFAGCSAVDVMAAVGLSLSDLFPQPLIHHGKPKRYKHWHATKEALKSLSDDALLVAIAAENLAKGVILDDKDRQLVIDAAQRIREARKVAV